MKSPVLFALFGFLLFVACNNQPDQKTESKAETMVENELLNQAQAIFQPIVAQADNAENPITPEKLTLGKMLYFDTRLSKTGNNSCNSCHNLATFGVDNLPTSKGDAGKFGERNSPTVLNAAIHFAQFWDGRAKDVEEQAGGPILNPVEMGIPSKEFLVKKLKAVPEYSDLFQAAFPADKDPLTYLNIQKAIAAFERTLMTPAPFDNYLKGDAEALSLDQEAGLRIFMDVGCITCHIGQGLGGSMFQKFGVHADYRTFTKSTVNDEGRKQHTKVEGDKDFFKVPSLRNVAKTAPYFHDGSISDLNESVKIMAKAQLNKDLTPDEVSKIVIFLTSLTGTLPEEVIKPPEMLTKK
jgi:cytochrome c peroxidase